MLLRALLFIVLACTAGSAEAYAQADTVAARRMGLLERLNTGTPIRVLVQRSALIAPFERVAADTLYFGPHAVAVSQISNVYVQQRSTRRGATVGALVGAPAGAAFGAFVMLFIAALSESEGDSDISTGEAVLGIAGFSAAGALSGAILGGVIGAATPRWVEITRASSLERTLDARPRSRTMPPLQHGARRPAAGPATGR